VSSAHLPAGNPREIQRTEKRRSASVRNTSASHPVAVICFNPIDQNCIIGSSNGPRRCGWCTPHISEVIFDHRRASKRCANAINTTACRVVSIAGDSRLLHPAGGSELGLSPSPLTAKSPLSLPRPLAEDEFLSDKSGWIEDDVAIESSRGTHIGANLGREISLSRLDP
jgi:hypothetical protein